MSRSVVITGASSGIGRSTALRLAGAGWRVFAGVRRAEDADALRDTEAGHIEPLLVDVTDQQSMEDARRFVDARAGGRLDALVNNAGIAIGGFVESTPPERWRHQLEVNVVGQVAMTQELLPALRGAGGRIVFVGSLAGRTTAPLMGPYNASKHALEAVAGTLRAELHGTDMFVSIVEPGAVSTEIWDKGLEQLEAIRNETDPEVLARYEDITVALEAEIQRSAEQALDADRVAAVIESVLDHRRPRLHHPVGADARIGIALTRFLPERISAAFLRRSLGL